MDDPLIRKSASAHPVDPSDRKCGEAINAFMQGTDFQLEGSVFQLRAVMSPLHAGDET